MSNQQDVATHEVEGIKLTFRQCVDEDGDVYFDVYDDTESSPNDPSSTHASLPLNVGEMIYLEDCSAGYFTDDIPNEDFAKYIHQMYLCDSMCEECESQKKIFIKDVDGTNLKEVYGCPKCDS